MRNLEVNFPQNCDLEQIDQIIESLCTQQGLTRKIKSTLRSYPGSTHWHYKKGYERGTLEITLWPKESRIWLSIHDNRRGSWTDGSARRLATAISEALKKGKASL
jgi:hypothetical protein